MSQKAFIARYLRTLSLRMMEGSQILCSSLDPILQPTWPGMIRLLRDTGRTNVTEASVQLRVSHVHAQNILKAMLKAEVVFAQPDENDGRRTWYSLTPIGEGLVPKIAALEAAMTSAIEDLEAEAGTDIVATLLELQDALDRQSWQDRVESRLQK